MNRRKFIKSGALFVPAIFVPRLILAQSISVLTAPGAAVIAAKKAAAGGGGGGGGLPSGVDVDWRLNNNTTDSSGNGNDGTVTGTTTYTTDEVGASNKAFSFASSTRIDAGSSSIANYTGDFSVSFWFKCTSSDLSGNPVIVSKSTFAVSGYYIQFHVQGGFPLSQGHIEFVTNNGSGNHATKTSDAGMAVNTWYHVVCVKSGSSGIIYVGGSDATASSDAVSPASDSNTLRLGDFSATGFPFTGAVAELSTWGRALSSSEVSTIFSGGSL